MKTYMYLAAVCLAAGLFTLPGRANAQEAPQPRAGQDSVVYRSMYWFPRFYHQDSTIKLDEVSLLLEANPEADRLMRQGKSIRVVSSILAAVGGFMLGYNLTNDDAQQQGRNLAIGGAITGGALLINVLALNRIKAAIDRYNAGGPAQATREVSLSWGLHQHSMCLRLTF